MNIRIRVCIVCLFALLPFGLSPETAAGQGIMVWSTSVQGLLNRQFSRHHLRLVPFDKRQSLRLDLEYVPQGRWELDNAADFFVVDDRGLQAVLNGDNPGGVAIAAGVPLPGFPRKLQAIILTPDDDQYHVVVVNNSPLPMGYTLTSSNGEIIDDAGRQVVDRWRLPIGAPGSASPFPLAVVPPQQELSLPAPVPAPVQGTDLHNRLLNKRATHYYELFVNDTGLPVVLTMTYDPPEQIHLPDGLNFYVFSDDQARKQAIGFLTPHLAPNTAAGKLRVTLQREFIWQAEIVTPAPHYTVIVSQFRFPLVVDYRISVENGLLVDRTGTAEPVVLVPAAPSITIGQPYTVRPGDTLAQIARLAYGDGQLATGLCAANRLPDCNRIEIGTVLMIPAQMLLPRPSLVQPQISPVHPITPAVAAPPTGPVLADNLADRLASEREFVTFNAILEPATELIAQLERTAPLTVLAPVESAFDSMDPNLFNLLFDEADPPVELLGGHILRGRLTTQKIKGTKQFRTLNNRLVQFERLPTGELSVNGILVDENAIPATNGVIYPIADVLQ